MNVYQIRNIEWVKKILEEVKDEFANTHNIVAQMQPVQLQQHGIVNQQLALDTLKQKVQVLQLTLRDLEKPITYDAPQLGTVSDMSDLPPIQENY